MATSLQTLSDRELLKRYHEDGDASAREALVQRHLPLVRSLARRYAGRGESLDDIEQVGAIVANPITASPCMRQAVWPGATPCAGSSSSSVSARWRPAGGSPATVQVVGRER